MGTRDEETLKSIAIFLLFPVKVNLCKRYHSRMVPNILCRATEISGELKTSPVRALSEKEQILASVIGKNRKIMQKDRSSASLILKSKLLV